MSLREVMRLRRVTAAQQPLLLKEPLPASARHFGSADTTNKENNHFIY
jgi:hypothetical protein